MALLWVRLGIASSAIAFVLLGMGTVCVRWEDECRMRGTVDLEADGLASSKVIILVLLVSSPTDIPVIYSMT